MKHRKNQILITLTLLTVIGLCYLIFGNLFWNPGDLRQPIGTLID